MLLKSKDDAWEIVIVIVTKLLIYNILYITGKYDSLKWETINDLYTYILVRK